jgi:hypothetical protein
MMTITVAFTQPPFKIISYRRGTNSGSCSFTVSKFLNRLGGGWLKGPIPADDQIFTYFEEAIITILLYDPNYVETG